jgi:predicted DNA-binding protein YlxM (UPF0122 family)
MSNEVYYSIPEYAKLKGISRQAVYLLINNKRLDTAIKYGKQLIINNANAKDYQPQPGRRSDLGK